MVCTLAALVPRAARLLAFIIFPFNGIVSIGAFAANGGETGGHWSLRPLDAPVIPQSSRDTSPVDAYITARLATNGLALSPAAFGTYGNGDSYDPQFYVDQSPYRHLATTGALNGRDVAMDNIAGLCSGAFVWPVNWS
jgi:hypothetical protein